MADVQLQHLLDYLGDAIRDLPAGEQHQKFVDRFFNVIAYLKSTGHIDNGSAWDLAPRGR